jgi:type IV secretory pathway TraG/TraD family ATPase VirD4
MIDTKSKWLTAGLVALILGGLYLAIHVGAALTPTGHTYSWNFFTLLGDMTLHGAPWPAAATGASVVAVVLALVVFVGFMAWLARRAANKRGNAAVKHMATRKQSAVLLEKARTKEAAQLHPNAPSLPAGQSVGRLVGTKKWVLQGWRELGVYVFGPGRGKTSGIVIRHMIEAPGAAIMTSNKVDGVRETLAGRQDRGRAFIFDPNRIYRRDFTPDFVFNPLDYIENAADAKELAAIFEASTRKASDRGGDAQFDTTGRDLLAYFFLAAKLDSQPLATVYDWIARSLGDVVQTILEEHDKHGPAATIAGIMLAADKTRSGYFTTAQRMASALADDELLQWTSAEGIRRFQPEEFITSTDTLVLLSKDGEGSGGALLTALVRTICKTAQRAAESNGGRLTVPLVMELDECANIVKWPELPSVYSYYGSLGIILNTYFQSRAQGIDAFGQGGWGTLWDAASNRVFGGGVLDDEFLKTIAALIGEHDEITYGSSTGRDGAMSTSTNTRKVNTMDVAALAALPEWRAIVFNSKCRPVMVQTVPWFRDKTLKAKIEGASAAVPVKPAVGSAVPRG